jgi:hypothetical protein
VFEDNKKGAQHEIKTTVLREKLKKVLLVRIE